MKQNQSKQRQHERKLIQSSHSGAIVLEPDAYDRFLRACEKGGAPNPALKRAARFAKERQILLKKK